MKTHDKLVLAIVLMLALAMTFALVGCGGDDATDETVAEETGAQGVDGETTTETQDDPWMVGTWDVVHTLVSVTPDADWSRQAADQPGTTLEIEVAGDEMTIADDDTTYVSTYVMDDDGSWHFDGMDTYTDADGVVWTSHLVVDVSKVDEDMFTAEQWGEISSDTDGVLYEAEWIADGVRTE